MAFDSSLLSFAGSYMRPHDIWNGGATTVYGGWSDLDSQDIVENIDLLGQGWFLGVVHSYKLIDDDERLVSLSAGLVYRYIEDQYLYSGTSLAQRDITVLPASLSLSYSARRADTFRGRNFATLQGVYNLATSGASEIDDWRTDADDNYVIGRMQVARLQPVFGSADPSDEKKMVHQWILFMKAEGQYASCPLLPAEELNLGGSGTLRGYTTKGYLGDNGVYGTLELRTPILLDMVSHLFGRKESNNPLDRIQFVAFTDFGYLETLDPLPGEEDSEALMSVGGGIRLAVTKYSQMRVDVGVPVASGSADDDSSAYYLDWQAQF
jgi:hemolysin activation/secretion protein